MTRWPAARLADLAEIRPGRTPRGLDRYLADHPRDDRTVPFYKVGDMNSHPSLLREARTYLSPGELSPLGIAILPLGSLVFPKAGGAIATNKKRIIGVPGAVDLNCMGVVPGPDLDQGFLYLWAESFDLSSIADGSVLPQISKKRVSELIVPSPPVSEQRRIVDILEDNLSRLDAADQGMATTLSKLAGLRERMIIDALTRPGASERAQANLPDVGTSDGDLPALTLGWSWARLGDVAEVVGGVTKDAKKQSDPTFTEVPYLRVANVQRGHLRLDNVTTIRVSPAKASALRLEHGDVLLNEGGDRDKLARGWVWEGQIADCIHQNHVFRARIHDRRLDPYFLSFTANTFGGRWAERNGKQSVNLASISLSMIRKMPVIVPAVGEAELLMRTLADQLDSYDRLEATLHAARARSLRLRRGLLAAAFSGRLTARAGEADLVEELADV